MASFSDSVQQSDSRFFSVRAMNIHQSFKTQQSAQTESSRTAQYFPFSHRPYSSASERTITQTENNGKPCIEPRYPVGTGRGRTTIPLSLFVSQKSTDSPISTSPVMMNDISSKSVVPDDEISSIQPDLAPSKCNDTDSSSSSSFKRYILLSAVKEIETTIKNL